jgi:hypothetical protein
VAELSVFTFPCWRGFLWISLVRKPLTCNCLQHPPEPPKTGGFLFAKPQVQLEVAGSPVTVPLPCIQMGNTRSEKKEITVAETQWTVW